MNEIANRKIEAAFAAGALTESSCEGARQVYASVGMDALDRFLDEMSRLRAKQTEPDPQPVRLGDGARCGDGSRIVFSNRKAG